MPNDYVYIGSSPANEDCAQVGAENYPELSVLELSLFRQCIIQQHGQPPEGASLIFKEGEVVCKYDDTNEEAAKYAYKCEETHGTWEEYGVKAPRLDDAEFRKTELIPVPEGADKTDMQRVQELLDGGGAMTVGAMLQSRKPPLKRPVIYLSPVDECDLKTAHGCIKKIGNEFVDGATKQGPWGIMCPACFGMSGKGLGTGVGQRYRKAVDGKFYKVEG